VGTQAAGVAASQLPRQFDLVVANILRGPLLELAPRLAAYCRPGGRLIVSGILTEQASDFVFLGGGQIGWQVLRGRAGWRQCAVGSGCRGGQDGGTVLLLPGRLGVSQGV
jgi:hypothetical protein